MVDEELASIAESVQKLIKINDDANGIRIYATQDYASIDYGNVTLCKGKDNKWRKMVTTEINID